MTNAARFGLIASLLALAGMQCNDPQTKSAVEEVAEEKATYYASPPHTQPATGDIDISTTWQPLGLRDNGGGP